MSRVHVNSTIVKLFRFHRFRKRITIFSPTQPIKTPKSLHSRNPNSKSNVNSSNPTKHVQLKPTSAFSIRRRIPPFKQFNRRQPPPEPPSHPSAATASPRRGSLPPPRQWPPHEASRAIGPSSRVCGGAAGGAPEWLGLLQARCRIGPLVERCAPRNRPRRALV